MTAAPHYDIDDPAWHAFRVGRLRISPGYGLAPSPRVGQAEVIGRPLSARPACVGYDPEIFFDYRTRLEALRICQSCKVKTECLEIAIEFESSDECVIPCGVFGGTLPQERRFLRAEESVYA